MYVIIMETGEAFKASEITEDDKKAWEEGIIDIIDTENLKQYTGSGWADMRDWSSDS